MALHRHILRKRLYRNVEPFSYLVIFVWDLRVGVWKPSRVESLLHGPLSESLLNEQAFVVLAVANLALIVANQMGFA